MKSEFTLIVVATSLAWASGNQSALAQAPPDAVVVERGPHHRIWERTLTETLPDGRTVERKSAYTELATGLHHKNERGEWIDSRELVEIFQGAAIARQGQHQVIFAANLNSPGAIDLLDPQGKRFRSHIVGLAYTDAASGGSVLIAETKDSTGAVLPPNQVIYQDAFAGDCVADVRFTYTLCGFEQDIILLTAPPSPAQWNLNPETTRLEIWTEFIELPEGTATSVVLKQESDPVLRQQMAEPDLIDQRLDFGVMKMEQGQAFPLGEADPFGGVAVPTGKSIERIDGRIFCIEKVDYRDIRGHLQTLPQQAAAKPPRKVFEPTNGQRLFAGMLPPAPKGERGAWKEKQYAKADPGRKGFVLDYVTLNGSLTNQIFRGDSTYCITNVVDLYGVTIIEGGAVLKYSTNSSLYVNGTLDCRTTPYRPAILTCKDDNTVGEIITGSTGNPLGYSASKPLGLKDTSATYQVSGLRIQRSTWGVNLYTGVKADFSHVQFAWCDRGVAWLSGALGTWRNFLFTDMAYAFYASGSGTNRAEHCTLHRVGTLLSNTNSGYLLTLTNSLLISATNNLVYQGINVVSSLDDAGFFQTVGAGARYLASGSTNRNAGTTNINPTLLADLKQRTTYPPLVLTNHITADLSLIPQAMRDTDSPDLGYHYDPLDYVVNQVSVTNSTLSILAGTAIGVYGGSGSHGLRLEDGSQVRSYGSPVNLCRIVRYNLVQEQGNTNWLASSVGRSVVDASWGGSPRPIAHFQFTDWSTPAGGQEHFAGDYGSPPDSAQFDFIHCQLRGGLITTLAADVTFTNCLFDRVGVLDLSAYSDYYNGLFRGGVFNVDGTFGAHNVSDCFFDRTYFDTNTWIGTINHHNGYITNEVRLCPEGTNSVIVTDMVYQAGPLGLFYQPTNSFLLNTGSMSAASARLYHFTTTTDQVKETNSVVDIGFHYVAVNSSNQPIDTDTDGLADVFEDLDGDGVVDSSETDWNNSTDLGLRVVITRPKNGGNTP